MNQPDAHLYSFGAFKLDAAKRLLFEGNDVVTLTPKAFDTLLALVENRGAVMSKQQQGLSLSAHRRGLVRPGDHRKQDQEQPLYDQDKRSKR